ncbi:MAG TPA: response regulator [Actinomycetota bacterium]
MLVEDDPGQALLIKRVLGRAQLMNPICAFSDGDQALSYLQGQDPSFTGDTPALILLDLHLPGKSGLEILEWIRAQDAFRGVPVLMLSASTESKDIDRAFELGADSYLIKPVAFDALVDLVTSLGLPWVILSREGTVARA